MTGAGRAFCAGFDLDDAEGLSSLSPMGMLTQQERAARALSALRALPFPFIAAVNGPATGGGLALALAADIRIGSPGARFNAAFVRIGLSAGDLGTSWLLPRLIGPARAAEFCYTGRFIEAEEAERHRPAQPHRARPISCWTPRSSWRRRSPPTRPAACSSPSARCRPTWRRRRSPPRWSSRTAARRC